MTNKLDKFGIKFWLAADVEFKYIPHAIPYLGKNEARPAAQRLFESVVIKIVQPLAKALKQNRYFSKLLQTKSDNNQATTLTVYQCKQNKNVCILRTLHTSVMVDKTTKKETENSYILQQN